MVHLLFKDTLHASAMPSMCTPYRPIFAHSATDIILMDALWTCTTCAHTQITQFITSYDARQHSCHTLCNTPCSTHTQHALIPRATIWNVRSICCTLSESIKHQISTCTQHVVKSNTTPEHACTSPYMHLTPMHALGTPCTCTLRRILVNNSKHSSFQAI